MNKKRQAETSKDQKELAKLANDEDPLVREGIAGNENASVDILQQLATDKELKIRYQIVMNNNTPAAALAKLTTDQDAIIRILASGHPSCPKFARLLMK